jgi:hypothetical protein
MGYWLSVVGYGFANLLKVEQENRGYLLRVLIWSESKMVVHFVLGFVVLDCGVCFVDFWGSSGW